MRLRKPRVVTKRDRIRFRLKRWRIRVRERWVRTRTKVRRGVVSTITLLWNALVGLVHPSNRISDEMLKLIDEGKILACVFCGYFHAVECPRVKRVKYRPAVDERTPIQVEEVEFWPKWSTKGMLDPTVVAVALAERGVRK